MTAAWESAIRRGAASVVRALLDGGVDVNARDHQGQTGVMLAALRARANEAARPHL